MSSGAGPPAQLSPALRALALILAIDLGIGLWLKLHQPDSLALFFLVNAPVIGLGSALWGLFPKGEQETASNWVSARLGAPGATRVLLGTAALLLVISLFWSSIEIDLVDPNAAASVMVVRGSQAKPDYMALKSADTIRLNRLTTPSHRVVAINPLGSTVWLHSATHVTFQDVRLLPWLPTRFQYPDDFVQLASIAVLPGDTLVVRMRDSLWLTLRQGGPLGPVYSQTLLDRAGFTVAYFEPDQPSPAVLQRWADSLMSWASAGDTDAIRQYARDQVQAWSKGRWVRASQPLRVGEDIFWQVQGPSDSIHANGKLRVTDALSDLHLRF